MRPIASTSLPITRALLSPRWIITTLLVVAAVIGMARLGFWQLDRLEERRAFNARVMAQINAAELGLNEALESGEVISEQLSSMEYRPVMVTGRYDHENEILLRNQVHENMPGYHLYTPLRLDGSDLAVLVDRGFIPMDVADASARAQYITTGAQVVRGVIRQPHVPRFFGAPDPALAPGETRLDAWNALNLERIQAQLPYTVLPVYIQAAPDDLKGAGDYPVAALEQPDITEGSHLSYAAQWFTFAGLLAVGYPFFIRRQLNAARKKNNLGQRVS